MLESALCAAENRADEAEGKVELLRGETKRLRTLSAVSAKQRDEAKAISGELASRLEKRRAELRASSDGLKTMKQSLSTAEARAVFLQEQYLSEHNACSQLKAKISDLLQIEQCRAEKMQALQRVCETLKAQVEILSRSLAKRTLVMKGRLECACLHISKLSSTVESQGCLLFTSSKRICDLLGKLKIANSQLKRLGCLSGRRKENEMQLRQSGSNMKVPVLASAAMASQKDVGQQTEFFLANVAKESAINSSGMPGGKQGSTAAGTSADIQVQLLPAMDNVAVQLMRKTEDKSCQVERETDKECSRLRAQVTLLEEQAVDGAVMNAALKREKTDLQRAYASEKAKLARVESTVRTLTQEVRELNAAKTNREGKKTKFSTVTDTEQLNKRKESSTEAPTLKVITANRNSMTILATTQAEELAIEREKVRVAERVKRKIRRKAEAKLHAMEQALDKINSKASQAISSFGSVSDDGNVNQSNLSIISVNSSASSNGEDFLQPNHFRSVDWESKAPTCSALHGPTIIGNNRADTHAIQEQICSWAYQGDVEQLLHKLVINECSPNLSSSAGKTSLPSSGTSGQMRRSSPASFVDPTSTTASVLLRRKPHQAYATAFAEGVSATKAFARKQRMILLERVSGLQRHSSEEKETTVDRADAQFLFCPLHRAVAGYLVHGSAEKVVNCLHVLATKANGNINERDCNGNTPVHHAIETMSTKGAHCVDEGDLKRVISYLVQHGADVNATNWVGETPLHLELAPSTCRQHGIRARSLSLIRFLVANGADVNALCRAQWGPLGLTLSSGLERECKRENDTEGAKSSHANFHWIPVASYLVRHRASWTQAAKAFPFLNRGGQRISKFYLGAQLESDNEVFVAEPSRALHMMLQAMPPAGVDKTIQAAYVGLVTSFLQSMPEHLYARDGNGNTAVHALCRRAMQMSERLHAQAGKENVAPHRNNFAATTPPLDKKKRQATHEVGCLACLLLYPLSLLSLSLSLSLSLFPPLSLTRSLSLSLPLPHSTHTTHVRTHIREHAHTHTRARMRTHTQMYTLFCLVSLLPLRWL